MKKIKFFVLHVWDVESAHAIRERTLRFSSEENRAEFIRKMTSSEENDQWEENGEGDYTFDEGSYMVTEATEEFVVDPTDFE